MSAASRKNGIRYWRADGDVTTNGTATANGAGAEQARKRRRSFARAITATEFADKRAGKLTLDTYARGRS